MKPLAILLFVAASLSAQGTTKWEHDYASALRQTKTKNKVIFMDLWTEWCGPCQRLQKDIFPTPEGTAALGKVVPFSALVQKRDGTPLPEGTKLAEKFNLNAFPTMVILDANGKELRRQVGLFRTGAEFAVWLNGK